MKFEIVYRSAITRHGRWVPKIAYKIDGMPAIVEGAPDCAYNTRAEALAAVPQLEADLRLVLAGAEGVEICPAPPLE